MYNLGNFGLGFLLILINLTHAFVLQEQQIVPEEEWDSFMSMLRKPLPATFRINAR
jgi:hypothetical protein